MKKQKFLKLQRGKEEDFILRNKDQAQNWDNIQENCFRSKLEESEERQKVVQIRKEGFDLMDLKRKVFLLNKW